MGNDKKNDIEYFKRCFKYTLTVFFNENSSKSLSDQARLRVIWMDHLYDFLKHHHSTNFKPQNSDGYFEIEFPQIDKECKVDKRNEMKFLKRYMIKWGFYKSEKGKLIWRIKSDVMKHVALYYIELLSNELASYDIDYEKSLLIGARQGVVRRDERYHSITKTIDPVSSSVPKKRERDESFDTEGVSVNSKKRHYKDPETQEFYEHMLELGSNLNQRIIEIDNETQDFEKNLFVTLGLLLYEKGVPNSDKITTEIHHQHDELNKLYNEFIFSYVNEDTDAMEKYELVNQKTKELLRNISSHFEELNRYDYSEKEEKKMNARFLKEMIKRSTIELMDYIMNKLESDGIFERALEMQNEFDEYRMNDPMKDDKLEKISMKVKGEVTGYANPVEFSKTSSSSITKNNNLPALSERHQSSLSDFLQSSKEADYTTPSNTEPSYINPTNLNDHLIKSKTNEETKRNFLKEREQKLLSKQNQTASDVYELQTIRKEEEKKNSHLSDTYKQTFSAVYDEIIQDHWVAKRFLVFTESDKMAVLQMCNNLWIDIEVLNQSDDDPFNTMADSNENNANPENQAKFIIKEVLNEYITHITEYTPSLPLRWFRKAAATLIATGMTAIVASLVPVIHDFGSQRLAKLSGTVDLNSIKASDLEGRRATMMNAMRADRAMENAKGGTELDLSANKIEEDKKQLTEVLLGKEIGPEHIPILRKIEDKFVIRESGLKNAVNKFCVDDPTQDINRVQLLNKYNEHLLTSDLPDEKKIDLEFVKRGKESCEELVRMTENISVIDDNTATSTDTLVELINKGMSTNRLVADEFTRITNKYLKSGKMDLVNKRDAELTMMTQAIRSVSEAYDRVYGVTVTPNGNTIYDKKNGLYGVIEKEIEYTQKEVKEGIEKITALKENIKKDELPEAVYNDAINDLDNSPSNWMIKNLLRYTVVAEVKAKAKVLKQGEEYANNVAKVNDKLSSEQPKDTPKLPTLVGTYKVINSVASNYASLVIGSSIMLVIQSSVSVGTYIAKSNAVQSWLRTVQNKNSNNGTINSLSKIWSYVSPFMNFVMKGTEYLSNILVWIGFLEHISGAIATYLSEFSIGHFGSLIHTGLAYSKGYEHLITLFGKLGVDISSWYSIIFTIFIASVKVYYSSNWRQALSNRKNIAKLIKDDKRTGKEREEFVKGAIKDWMRNYVTSYQDIVRAGGAYEDSSKKIDLDMVTFSSSLVSTLTGILKLGLTISKLIYLVDAFRTVDISYLSLFFSLWITAFPWIIQHSGTISAFFQSKIPSQILNHMNLRDAERALNERKKK